MHNVEVHYLQNITLFKYGTIKHDYSSLLMFWFSSCNNIDSSRTTYTIYAVNKWSFIGWREIHLRKNFKMKTLKVRGVATDIMTYILSLCFLSESSHRGGSRGPAGETALSTCHVGAGSLWSQTLHWQKVGTQGICTQPASQSEI